MELGRVAGELRESVSAVTGKQQEMEGVLQRGRPSGNLTPASRDLTKIKRGTRSVTGGGTQCVCVCVPACKG